MVIEHLIYDMRTNTLAREIVSHHIITTYLDYRKDTYY
jgi:hypothetical protein